jgi:hypothetical protein
MTMDESAEQLKKKQRRSRFDDVAPSNEANSSTNANLNPIEAVTAAAIRAAELSKQLQAKKSSATANGQSNSSSTVLNSNSNIASTVPLASQISGNTQPKLNAPLLGQLPPLGGLNVGYNNVISGIPDIKANEMHAQLAAQIASVTSLLKTVQQNKLNDKGALLSLAAWNKYNWPCRAVESCSYMIISLLELKSFTNRSICSVVGRYYLIRDSKLLYWSEGEKKAMYRPLLLDSMGREVDEFGQVRLSHTADRNRHE